MKRPFFILVLALALSCSDDDNTPASASEDQAIMLASAKCGCLPKMPWLRNIIRQSEVDVNTKGNIYAISYSGGVAVMHQPWISSCLGCLVYDCDGKKLTLNESAMNEIISGATEANVIYSPL